MHTAACNIFRPAYRHKRNTPAPSIRAAESVTVNVITSFHRWFAGAGPAGYPIPELRGILRRSQRALNLHFSHVLPPSAASAPHEHCRPLRHPFNLCPIVITSCQRSLAFGKVRDAKTRRSPDTIGSGKRRAFPSGQPRPIPVCCGAARLYSVILVVLSGPARAVSSPARAGCFSSSRTPARLK